MKKLLCLLTIVFGLSIFASQAEAENLQTTTFASGHKTTTLHAAKKHKKHHHKKRRKHHRTTHHVSFASSNGVHWQK